MRISALSASPLTLLLALAWSSALQTSCIAHPRQHAAKPAGTKILTVGPGMTYALPSEAARAAKAGNMIRIFPGTYTDCAKWDANGLVIEGAGPNVVVANKVCDDKGIFITRGNDITIRNITFKSASAYSHNGAGIRAEGANLTVEDSRFIDNEDGILSTGNAASTIVIRSSFFRGNGNCIAACAHGIYIGHVSLLRVENCTFEEQHVGHHIKSRAARTEIVDNVVKDGPNGSASYLVDLPNGGSALISGNVFEKGPNSANRRTAIAVGAEKETNPAGEIVLEDNSFSNDSGVETAFVRNSLARPVILLRNRFSGDVTPVDKPEQSEANRTRP
jgi:hypothetical protein